MVMFILGILLIILGPILYFTIRPYSYNKNRHVKAKSWLLTSVLGLIVLIFSIFAVVPTGYTGILVTMGKVATYTLDAGLNVVLPWQDVILMDNREQKIAFSQQAFSSDIQQVELTGSVIFSIDKSTAMDLYRSVGTNYAEIVINPQIAEDVKAVISRYTAEGLIGQRAILSNEMLAVLREDLATYGLNIISVAIENIDFSDAFEQAVEAKQVATQTKQRAQTEQEQQTMEAQQAAERQRIQAQADADVAKINADAEAYAITAQAEAKANANKQIADSLTDSFINYTQIISWDGKLPSMMVGGDVSTIPIVSPATVE